MQHIQHFAGFHNNLSQCNDSNWMNLKKIDATLMVKTVLKFILILAWHQQADSYNTAG